MKGFKGYALIIGAALLWGSSATLAKSLLNQQLDTLLLVQTRSTFSCIIMLAFFAAFQRRYLRIAAKDIIRFLLLGVIGLAGANFTYYFTIKESTVGTAITIQYTAPLFVMAYEVWRKEERFTTVKVVAAVLSLCGCFLTVTGLDLTTMQISQAGLLTGIGSILTFSFLTIATRHLVAHYSPWTVTFYSIAFASLFWLVVNPPWNVGRETHSAEVWQALLLLAVLSILLPNLMFTAGLRHVVPSRAVITSTLEPVVAIVSAAVFLSEVLAPVQVTGAALVILAIIILQLRREESPVEEPAA